MAAGSVYMSKDAGQPLVMGPPWDFVSALCLCLLASKRAARYYDTLSPYLLRERHGLVRPEGRMGYFAVLM